MPQKLFVDVKSLSRKVLGQKTLERLATGTESVKYTALLEQKTALFLWYKYNVVRSVDPVPIKYITYIHVLPMHIYIKTTN